MPLDLRMIKRGFGALLDIYFPCSFLIPSSGYTKKDNQLSTASVGCLQIAWNHPYARASSHMSSSKEIKQCLSLSLTQKSPSVKTQ